jgi:carbamate kinase
MKIIVVALGGNALLDPSSKQSFAKENRYIDLISKDVVALCKDRKCKMIITHGNGSQVGEEVMRNEHASLFVPKLPLYVINAETQALLGTVIETSLRNSLNKLNLDIDVCVILAHVVVDTKDHAFKKPTKQIGPFYSQIELSKELSLNKFNYIKSGSKYRKVVASPKPKIILELGAIKKQIDSSIVITCGGGGVPVVKKNKKLLEVDAVIDKDLTSQLLANSIKADTLVILTNADYLYSNYSKKIGRIKEISASILRKKLNMFEEGTIKPKIEACVRFIENGGKEAYIGNIFKLKQILDRKSGTRIH